MTAGTLEARLREVEDKLAIQELMSLYCFHADNRDGANWSEVFAEDGVFEADLLGSWQGREAIKALRHRDFAIHYNTNSIIKIDGDTAFGRWLLFMPTSLDLEDGSHKPVWAAAKYENDLVRVNGAWKFKKVKLISIMWASFEEGWEKNRFSDMDKK